MGLQMKFVYYTHKTNPVLNPPFLYIRQGKQLSVFPSFPLLRHLISDSDNVPPADVDYVEVPCTRIFIDKLENWLVSKTVSHCKMADILCPWPSYKFYTNGYSSTSSL